MLIASFLVIRERTSPTQGVAKVYLNSAEVAVIEDTFEPIKAGVPYYGSNLKGLVSTKHDSYFIDMVMRRVARTKVQEILHSDKRGPIYSERMTKDSRVYIDVDARIEAAATQEEKDAWESKRGDLEKHDIDFCAGWHVGIYKHACGHWEILQSPIYGKHKLVDGRPYSAADADRELRRESANSVCTRCH